MRRILPVVLMLAVFLSTEAGAQDVRSHKYEIIPFGGYMWSSGRNVLFGGRNGKLITESSPMWGVAVDINLKKRATQLELMYSRQESKYEFELEGEKTYLSDVAIEYLHVGLILGGDESRRYWYTSLAIGATHYGLKAEGYNDEWRFSLAFGLGMKYYIGKRVALRFQGRAPYTVIGGSGDFICDDDIGCVKNAGGNGAWQYELSVGLAILL